MKTAWFYNRISAERWADFTMGLVFPFNGGWIVEWWEQN